MARTLLIDNPASDPDRVQAQSHLIANSQTHCSSDAGNMLRRSGIPGCQSTEEDTMEEENQEVAAEAAEGAEEAAEGAEEAAEEA
ncbi:MAG: hypothetical protein ACKOFX_01250 [Solirubrobacterales bacterium]